MRGLSCSSACASSRRRSRCEVTSGGWSAFSLDQVGERALAVAERGVKRDRLLDQVEELLDAALREAGLLRDLRQQRVAV